MAPRQRTPGTLDPYRVEHSASSKALAAGMILSRQSPIPSTDFIFDRRATPITREIPAAHLAILTLGYSKAGDGGGGMYERMSAAPADPSHPGYFRSQDRYLPSGSLDSVNGGYWQLVADKGNVTIEQFGGKADYNGSVVVTDSYNALMAALTYYSVSAGDERTTYIINWKATASATRYYIGQTVHFFAKTYMRGFGDGLIGGWVTQIHFPGATTGFVFHNHRSGPGENDSTTGGLTYGTAYGSVIEGIELRSKTVSLIRCSVAGWCGDAFSFVANVGQSGAGYGNANNWRMFHCAVNSCNGNALYVEGSDVNGGSCIGFVTQGSVSGCGINDQANIGTAYSHCQISAYHNRGVSHGGNLYVLISGTANIGSTTTPGTDDRVWYFVGVGAPGGLFPAWSAANEYFVGCPVYSGGGPSTFDHIYVEVGGASHSHIPPLAVARQFGGPYTRYSNVQNSSAGPPGEAFSQGIRSGVSFDPDDAGFALNGSGSYARIGGEHLGGFYTTHGMGILTHYRARDAAAQTVVWGYSGNDIKYGYLSQKLYWEQTTPSTTRNFGRTAPVSYVFCPYDIGLVNPLDDSIARIYGVRSVAPSSGNAGRGEFWFKANPSGGDWLGWSTTVGGVYGSTAVSAPAGPIATDALGYLNFAGDKRSAGSQDITNNTTLANNAWLVVNVSAGRRYRFRAVLPTVSGAGGVKFGIGGSATATSIWYQGITYSGNAIVANDRVSVLGAAVGGVTAVTGALTIIEGFIQVNGAGTLAVQFAQNAASGATSFLITDATFSVTDVA
jgi:hypothetical protein